MFGRIRTGQPLDFLDGPPSKIIKDDPLSIYEVTILKLKQGARNDRDSHLGAAPMIMDIDSTSESTSPSSIDSQSSINYLEERQEKGIVSIHSWFSKYKSFRERVGISNGHGNLIK